VKFAPIRRDFRHGNRLRIEWRHHGIYSKFSVTFRTCLYAHNHGPWRWTLQLKAHAQGERKGREERKRELRERQAHHTRNLKTRRPPTTKKKTDSPVFTVYLRTIPYIYRTWFPRKYRANTAWSEFLRPRAWFPRVRESQPCFHYQLTLEAAEPCAI